MVYIYTQISASSLGSSVLYCNKPFQPASMAEPGKSLDWIAYSKDTSKVFERLHTCLEKLTVLTKEAAEWMQDLRRKNAEVDLQMKRISIDCLGVAMQCRAYLLEVDVFAWYAERKNRKRKIFSALQRRFCCRPWPNYRPMNDYIKQLKRCLCQAEKKYEAFHSSSNKLLQNLAQVSKDCKENEGAARSKEVATRVTGGVLAGGAMAAGLGGASTTAAVGIGLSIAAGVPTLGVGTIVGLAVTGVATAGVGVGVGGTVAGFTHYIASEFKETKKMFAKMDNYSNEMRKCSADLQSSLSEVHVPLDKIDSLMNDVEYSKTLCETQDPLFDAAQLLFERMQEFGIKITECRESLNRNIEALEAANHKVFE